jgi:DNA-binding NarL/FixJ family response regulator
VSEIDRAGRHGDEAAETTAPIRVAVVDDQPLVREGLRALLERAGDIQVVGEAGDGREGIALVRRTRPRVVLMDVRMPGIDGITATSTILDDPDLVRTAVVVLTTFDTDRHVFDAIRAGAAGFLLKDTSPDALRDAVRVVARGEALLSPAVTARVMAAARTRGRLARGPRADRGPHRTGARGPRHRRAWPEQRRDRGAAVHQPGHGADPRGPAPDEDVGA